VVLVAHKQLLAPQALIFAVVVAVAAPTCLVLLGPVAPVVWLVVAAVWEVRNQLAAVVVAPVGTVTLWYIRGVNYEHRQILHI
jgi:hypothetical protein